MRPVWLTVDSDDIRHKPIFQGHPTRSKGTDLKNTSDEMIFAMSKFEEWLDKTQVTITIFVIADQLDDEEFVKWLSKLIDKHPQVTIGCHGLTHKCWSAYDEDTDGFMKALLEAKSKLMNFAKGSYRPWFRAPAGYIAPWMAPVISEAGFEIDSSVNPSWLVRKKAGPWKDWNAVEKALYDSGVKSMPWLTKFSLPTCGPALSIPFLRFNAKRVWKKLGPFVLPDEAESTIYWHILDHGRNEGNWKPPLLL